jgi:hypothetical protein
VSAVGSPPRVAGNSEIPRRPSSSAAAVCSAGDRARGGEILGENLLIMSALALYAICSRPYGI